MKFTLVKKATEAITRKSCKMRLLAKKHSPELLVGAGIACVIGGTVVACKETLKMKDIMDERKKTIDEIKQFYKDEKAAGRDTYSKEDGEHDILIVNSQTAVKIVKNYLPSAGIIVAGFTCILAAFKIMSKRNAALTAAYNALKISYDQYRARVRAKYGDEADRDLLFDLDHIEKVYDQFTPEEKAEHERDPKMPPWTSDYAKFFDADSSFWDKDPAYNKATLYNKQEAMNKKLKKNGHVFLNEVYDALDIPRTQAGAVVGWVYNNGEGDNYISFGLDASDNERARKCLENVWLLDFNVDGIIYDKLKWRT